MTRSDQFVFDLGIVLDDPVVDESDPARTIQVWVRVPGRWLSMRCPPRMPDSDVPSKIRRDRYQVIDASFGLVCPDPGIFTI